MGKRRGKRKIIILRLAQLGKKKGNSSERETAPFQSIPMARSQRKTESPLSLARPGEKRTKAFDLREKARVRGTSPFRPLRPPGRKGGGRDTLFVLRMARKEGKERQGGSGGLLLSTEKKKKGTPGGSGKGRNAAIPPPNTHSPHR